jgi:hypothetical protein
LKCDGVVAALKEKAFKKRKNVHGKGPRTDLVGGEIPYLLHLLILNLEGLDLLVKLLDLFSILKQESIQLRLVTHDLGLGSFELMTRFVQGCLKLSTLHFTGVNGLFQDELFSREVYDCQLRNGFSLGMEKKKKAKWSIQNSKSDKRNQGDKSNHRQHTMIFASFN